MNPLVSKVRARKTRNRERQAARSTGTRHALEQNPWLTWVMMACFGVVVILLLGAGRFLSDWREPAFILPLWANALLCMSALFAVGIFIKTVNPRFAARNTHILLLLLIPLVALVPARILLILSVRTGLVPPDIVVFLLPHALAPLLGVMLVDGAIGLSAGVWVSLVMAVMASASLALTTSATPPAPDMGLVVLVTGLIAAGVTVHLGREVRTRSRVFRTGFFVGLAKIVGVLAFLLLRWQTADPLRAVFQAGACVLSGCISAAAVLLILPLFEAAFRVATNITLLELSDPGHLLLQRLALEAPGTYHHSLIVASLAQAAADEIGANGLLARVGAYFHDIGKLTKPEFFAENLQMQANPHDSLPPSMSTLVITSHVKEGLSLALFHKLPGAVLDVIREHHGTSLLSCFHFKARSQVETEGNRDAGENGKPAVNDADFRYPGPKPSSRESAIIALADAVEAASRTIENNKPAHIESLVNDIANTKFRDGQFDQCDLTLAELARVKRSFVFSLTNILHGRVPYPKDESTRQL